MNKNVVRGIDLLRNAVGQRLTGMRRYVLDLGQSNDEEGHGITELRFDDVILVIRPGRNEDYIIVEEGPILSSNLDPEYWTEIDLSRQDKWSDYRGQVIRHIDCYTDGCEDVALVFRMNSGDHFSVVLCDTDLILAEELEPFDNALDKVAPQLRERIG